MYAITSNIVQLEIGFNKS